MHEAEQINIICTDPRIQRFYYDYLIKEDLFGKFDSVVFENPILAFLNPATQVSMMERIGNYIKLHNPKKVVIIDHTDCGAYKLNGYNFKDSKEEIDIHYNNNNKVSNLILDAFPQLDVEIKIIVIEGDRCSWF